MSTNRPLLLDSDPVRLARLHAGLRRAGIDAIAAERIAEVERWPSDTLVITDIDRFTPWWFEVGATGVIVLANTAEQGVEACRRGATTWLLRNCTVGKLVAVSGAMLSLRRAGPSAAAANAGRKLAD